MWLPATQVLISASEPRQRSTALHTENCFLSVSWVVCSPAQNCAVFCVLSLVVWHATKEFSWCVQRWWSYSCNSGSLRNASARLGQIVCRWCGLNDEAKRLTSAMCLSEKCKWTMLVLAFWHLARSGARSTPSNKEEGQRSYFKIIAMCQF